MKIRKGFVSNSSSTSFTVPLTDCSTDLINLAMAFEEVKILDDGLVQVKCPCGGVAKKILSKLNISNKNIKWGNLI